MLLWLSLAVALVAFLGSLVFAGVRGLALWRQFKASSRALAQELERLTDAAEAVSLRAEGLGGATEKLDASLARLGSSRARLAVLQEAWNDVRAVFGGATAYVPREKKA